jgi:hypothetical protein
VLGRSGIVWIASKPASTRITTISSRFAGAIGADDEIARRVLAKLDPRDGLPVGMLDVLIADTVPASRRVNLHTQ